MDIDREDLEGRSIDCMDVMLDSVVASVYNSCMDVHSDGGRPLDCGYFNERG